MNFRLIARHLGQFVVVLASVMVACALLSGMVSRSNGFIYTRRDSAIGIICKSDSRSHQRSLLVDGIGFDLEISLASRTTAASGIR